MAEATKIAIRNHEKPTYFIPPEITDRIIALLDAWDPHERLTLLSCSLVCQNWLPASRVHLFRCVKITSKQGFTAAVLRSDSMQPWLLHTAFLVIDSLESLALQPFVHQLAGRLPNLQTLTLYHIDWLHTAPHPSTFHAFAGLPALHTVSLSTCTLPSFSAFRRMLLALPHLAVLTLSDAEWPSDAQHAPLLHAHGPRRCGRPAIVALRILSILPSCARDLFEWLLTTPTAQTIRALHYHNLESWSDAPIQFVQTSARSMSSLRVLRLTADFLRLQLPELVQLRELWLRIDTDHPWRVLADALQQLRCRRLRQLTLCDIALDNSLAEELGFQQPIFSPLRLAVEYSDELELLDSALESESFRWIARVRFCVSRPEGVIRWNSSRLLEEEIGRELQRKLPKLHARGIIQVVRQIW